VQQIEEPELNQINMGSATGKNHTAISTRIRRWFSFRTLPVQQPPPPVQEPGLLWPKNSYLVLQGPKLIYCPIAKNASSTLKRLFVRLSDLREKESFLESGKVHASLQRNRTGLSLKDYPEDEAERMIRSRDYFRIVVLRNPYERLVSGYLHKFVLFPNNNPTCPPHRMIREAIAWVYERNDRSVDYRRSITFRHFVDYLVRNDDEHIDAHWKPQVNYLSDVSFDYYGCVEQIDDLQRVLRERLGNDVMLECSNVFPNAAGLVTSVPCSDLLPGELVVLGALPNSAQLIDSSLRPAVRQRYKDDFDLYERLFGQVP